MSKERLYCNHCQLELPGSDFSEMARAQARAGDTNAACQNCVDKFYHSRLTSKEALAMAKEEEHKRLQRQRLYGQAERVNPDKRWCRALHHSDFIAKLRTLIPGLIVMPGTLPENLSLYRMRVGNEPEFLGWMQEGYSPEYDIIHTDARDLPSGQTRGWRTVLLRLIKARIITEGQLQSTFGHPTNPAISGRFYLEGLQDARAF